VFILPHEPKGVPELFGLQSNKIDWSGHMLLADA